MSKEFCSKISEAHKGKKLGPCSEETKSKMSTSAKKSWTDERRCKLSESKRGWHKGMTWTIIEGKRVWRERNV